MTAFGRQAEHSSVTRDVIPPPGVRKNVPDFARGSRLSDRLGESRRRRNSEALHIRTDIPRPLLDDSLAKAHAIRIAALTHIPVTKGNPTMLAKSSPTTYGITPPARRNGGKSRGSGKVGKDKDEAVELFSDIPLSWSLHRRRSVVQQLMPLLEGVIRLTPGQREVLIEVFSRGRELLPLERSVVRDAFQEAPLTPALRTALDAVLMAIDRNTSVRTDGVAPNPLTYSVTILPKGTATPVGSISQSSSAYTSHGFEPFDTKYIEREQPE